MANWTISDSGILSKRVRSQEDDDFGHITKKPTFSNMRRGRGGRTLDRQQNAGPPIQPFLSNKFSALGGKKIDEIPKEKKNNNKIIVPPIIFNYSQRVQINEILTKINIKEYNFKNMSIGIKLQLNNLDDYKKIKEEILDKKLKFFTYDEVKKDIRKIVLSGLPSLSPDEVKAALLDEAKIEVIDLKAMNLRKTRYDNQALFLISITKSNVEALMNLKYLLHTVVHFRKYVQPRNGPIQCTKCYLHGHGERNCHLSIRCPNCGDEHELESCQLSLDTPKCCNCGGTHAASFKLCQSRTDFIKMKQRNSSKKEITKRQSVFQPNYNLDFPSTFQQKPPKINPLYNWSTRSHHQTPVVQEAQQSESLFSPSELMQILTDVMTSLQSCKNKMDQLRLVADIAMKYINGST